MGEAFRGLFVKPRDAQARALFLKTMGIANDPGGEFQCREWVDDRMEAAPSEGLSSLGTLTESQTYGEAFAVFMYDGPAGEATAFAYEHAVEGRIVRALAWCGGMYFLPEDGAERPNNDSIICWRRLEGEPEAWETPFFFTQGGLDGELRGLRNFDDDFKAASDAEKQRIEADLQAYWTRGVQERGRSVPSGRAPRAAYAVLHQFKVDRPSQDIYPREPEEPEEDEEEPVTAPSASDAAFVKTLRPSAALAEVVGSEPRTQTEITKRLWDYIKVHQLQDPTKSTVIRADAKLRALFGKDSATMFEIPRIVGKHLS